jgi:hypothetical protein
MRTTKSGEMGGALSTQGGIKIDIKCWLKNLKERDQHPGVGRKTILKLDLN